MFQPCDGRDLHWEFPKSILHTARDYGQTSKPLIASLRNVGEMLLKECDADFTMTLRQLFLELLTLDHL